MQLSPDQFSSLKRVIADPAAKLAGILGEDFGLMADFVGKLEQLSRANVALGGSRILFIYDKTAKGTEATTPQKLSDEIRNGKQIITVDSNIRFVTSRQGEPNIVLAGDVSDKGTTIAAICEAGRLIIFAKGRPIADWKTVTEIDSTRSDWRRSHTEMRLCMDDHFKHCIEDESNVMYWADKKNRILLAGKYGTEKIFHQSLFWWLKKNLSDALDVYGETQGMGQIKTDITVVTEIGRLVIEVKWLGISESSGRYGEIRIREGLEQIAIYLDKDSKMHGGYLVLYDARKEAEHKANSSYPDSCIHDRCEVPIIYFLQSETPSVIASQRAKK